MKFLIINGPNLNLLGKREPHIYGTTTFDEYLTTLRKSFTEDTIDYFQSNIEGELINTLQSSNNMYDGVVINPGAYSHTSIAIADAISSINAKIVEVHISNIMARESYRHHSYISPKVIGTITGLGLKGYELAISFLKEKGS